jgi:predicted Zn-dependent protease
MINMKYGRDDEIESDRLGLRIMAEAGYDPRAMVRVMEVLAKASGGSRQPDFLSTHPAPEDRAARIREEIAKLQAGNYERR